MPGERAALRACRFEGTLFAWRAQIVHTTGCAADTLLTEDVQYVQELGAVLQQVEEDARESMQAIGRFVFFANGRA